MSNGLLTQPYGGVFEAGGLKHEVPTRLRTYAVTGCGDLSLAVRAMTCKIRMASASIIANACGRIFPAAGARPGT
jgi:hypothetical protein